MDYSDHFTSFGYLFALSQNGHPFTQAAAGVMVVAVDYRSLGRGLSRQWDFEVPPGPRRSMVYPYIYHSVLKHGELGNLP